MKQFSFSHLEKEYAPQIRDGINNAENKIDLQNHFSELAANLLIDATNNSLTIRNEDILFNPETANRYSLNPELLKNPEFKSAWENSDLPNMMEKFAESVNNRWIHLDKHPEKTEKKIRN